MSLEPKRKRKENTNDVENVNLCNIILDFQFVIKKVRQCFEGRGRGEMRSGGKRNYERKGVGGGGVGEYEIR